MSKQGTYAVISYEEYEAYFQKTYPNARVSVDGSEVLLSTNKHDIPCRCMSHEDAKELIASHKWQREEDL